MRRSGYVAAPLLASAAVALLSGCRTTEMERCVDEQNHVVDQSFCQTITPGSNQVSFGPRPGGGHIYRYYYGGRGSYAAGSYASGGSYAPSAGRSYAPSSGHSFTTTSTGTSRGGFGSSFSSGGHASGGE